MPQRENTIYLPASTTCAQESATSLILVRRVPGVLALWSGRRPGTTINVEEATERWPADMPERYREFAAGDGSNRRKPVSQAEDYADYPLPTKPRLPRQIAYIIGNEGCERFSFYGMRNILTQFLVSSALLYGATELVPLKEREGAAKEVFHTFVLGVYFFPLLGGWISDRFLGKYRTILYLSLIYCVGQACLALFVDNKAGFYLGLFLIALGSGGIKPCLGVRGRSVRPVEQCSPNRLRRLLRIINWFLFASW